MKHNLAIIIPTYKQYFELSPSEKLSLRRTFEVLGSYDIVFVTHNGIDAEAYYQCGKSKSSIQVLNFSDEYFTGLEGYNKLLLGLEFYKNFVQYDYILICQLDVFVFADKLDYFIDKKYDYIGAPWFEGFGTATPESPIKGVGNGGFSLRKVKSFLRVRYAMEIFSGHHISYNVLKEAARHSIELLRIVKHEYHRRTQTYDEALPWDTPLYEDCYWATIVPTFFPWFKIGSVDDATRFAFEVNPRVLYALNEDVLPMATHAWEKYDPDFWRPFIEPINEGK
ncbi:DUF5672 family protein [Hymenobacter arizonensis]|uniref:DUF5672 domain-containing protein n=1 Tax=Hymenobacter arizonensis TaxID=1227077 RepID=A0A1I5YQW7_HYMAR|nr:DUF5672 family protein [Hymenobacter arizonensis]SFQ46648.1 hypothetical protein SAMN04515668_2377 [Hymenobacter arizonensis]